MPSADTSEATPHGAVAIPLTNGGSVLVDEEDICRVSEYRWHRRDRKNGISYAYAMMHLEGKRKTVSMHRFLYGLSRDDRVQVDHRNHDGLDNRRSVNLRLASPAQNTANSRKLTATTSRYIGVYWKERERKWIAQIRVGSRSAAKLFFLGRFDTESEAAFAYQVGAPLLKDPDFIHPTAIPAHEIPSPSRQGEIRRQVLAKIKSVVRGGKGRLNCGSGYLGVSRRSLGPRYKNMATLPHWQCNAMVRGRVLYLGLYHTEIEAAYAYNVARDLDPRNRKTNILPGTPILAESRKREIKEYVVSKIDGAFNEHPGTMKPGSSVS